MRDSGSGMSHPYLATQQSGHYFECLNGMALAFIFPALVITLPGTIIDMGASIVTDTLLLPYDLAVETEYERHVNKGCFH